ncbi:hypothetical protein ACFQY9_27515 [Microvirga aerilata]|nr:hypothetical protein [Microvirga aerilata]
MKFLLSQKYPDWAKIKNEYNQARGRERSTLSKEIEKIDLYLMGLEALPKYVLELFYQEELKKVDVETRRSVEEHERFLNCEDADARPDFNHWTRLDRWNADEAAALMLGRDPVTVAKRQAAFRSNRFKKELNKYKDLIERAQQVRALAEMMTPSELMHWARGRNHPFPTDLEAAIQGSPAHYRASLDANALGAQIAVLTDENKRLAQDLRREKLRDDGRESLLKLIIGLAVGGYKYVPDVKYNKALEKIKTSLELLGLEIDEKTIRKCLSMASKTLDPKVKEHLKTGS